MAKRQLSDEERVLIEATGAENTDNLAGVEPELPADAKPDAMMILAQSFAHMTALMQQLVERQNAVPNDDVGKIIATLAPALERMAESNLAGAKLITEEQRRAHRPSNEFVHQRSVFNRRGVLLAEQHPEGVSGATKVPLKCLMLLPWLAEWESLTREEVDLLNLLEPGEYLVKRIDNSKIKVTVAMQYKEDNITPTRLVVNHETAFNNDNKNLWPNITDWTRQILRQHGPVLHARASAVMTDEEEEALIEAGELLVSV